jgi:hypothetical protein
MKFLSALFGRGRPEPQTVNAEKDGLNLKIHEDGSYSFKFEDKPDPFEQQRENERALDHLMHWCSQFYHRESEVDWRALFARWLDVGWGIRDIAYDYDRMLWLAKAWYQHPSTAGGQPVRFIGREIQIVPRPAKLDFMPGREEFAALAARFRAEEAARRAEERGNRG